MANDWAESPVLPVPVAIWPVGAVAIAPQASDRDGNRGSYLHVASYK